MRDHQIPFEILNNDLDRTIQEQQSSSARARSSSYHSKYHNLNEVRVHLVTCLCFVFVCLSVGWGGWGRALPDGVREQTVPDAIVKIEMKFRNQADWFVLWVKLDHCHAYHLAKKILWVKNSRREPCPLFYGSFQERGKGHTHHWRLNNVDINTCLACTVRFCNVHISSMRVVAVYFPINNHCLRYP